MIDPGFPLFVSALLFFTWGLYYLFINKKVSKKWWPWAVKFFYVVFVVSCLVIIWSIVYIIMTKVMG